MSAESLNADSLKIVHVLTRLLRAGSEENTLHSCRSQRDAGHQVWLVHGDESDPAVARRAAEVATVIEATELVHPISPMSDIRAVRRMAALFREIKPDVVHTHQSKAGILGRIAARMAGVPTIVHGVHILPFVNVGLAQTAIYVGAERLCATFTDAFVNVSPSVRDTSMEYGIGAANQHFVAYSAMDVERFKDPKPPADWREVLGVADGADKPPTVVMLAAFEPRKRHVEFVNALPEAFAGLPDWRVVFAGEGAEMPAAKAAVAALGLADKVRFTGYRTDPEAIIALADVCVLASLREGLPRVLVQYAAAGKPSVVSALPGLEDVIADGVSAVVTPSADISAAASAVARLLADDEERGRLAAGAAAIDVDAWSPASMHRAIQGAYDYARANPIRGRAKASRPAAEPATAGSTS
jgi:glycosyltransferase involved in cell wall biosynthesis